MTKQGFIIALWWSSSGCFWGPHRSSSLSITQNAIVVQLGKPVRNLTEPGLYVKMPFIQEVTYFDKRLLDYDSDPQDVITQDKKTLLLDNFC
jgi:membrane protease subunit HflC